MIPRLVEIIVLPRLCLQDFQALRPFEVCANYFAVGKCFLKFELSPVSSFNCLCKALFGENQSCQWEQ